MPSCCYCGISLSGKNKDWHEARCIRNPNARSEIKDGDFHLCRKCFLPIPASNTYHYINCGSNKQLAFDSSRDYFRQVLIPDLEKPAWLGDSEFRLILRTVVCSEVGFADQMCHFFESNKMMASYILSEGGFPKHVTDGLGEHKLGSIFEALFHRKLISFEDYMTWATSHPDFARRDDDFSDQWRRAWQRRLIEGKKVNWIISLNLGETVPFQATTTTTTDSTKQSKLNNLFWISFCSPYNWIKSLSTLLTNAIHLERPFQSGSSSNQ